MSQPYNVIVSFSGWRSLTQTTFLCKQKLPEILMHLLGGNVWIKTSVLK